MRESRRALFFAALLPIALYQPPAAAEHPAVSWHSLRTPHFHIHYPEGAYRLAQRTARAAEAALEQVGARLRHTPFGRIEIVISDDTDSANGSARVIPYNLVHVFAAPPEDLSVLHDVDNYLAMLLLHELTHIVQMDMVAGLPAWVNRVFGRTVFPNGAQPTWIIEGLAVHFESALSSAGRIRSSLFQMILRTAVLEGAFPGLDQVTNGTRLWPQGTVPYLYGGFFVDHLGQKFGDEALAEIAHDTSDEVLPWAENAFARRALGADYVALWDDWRRGLEGEAQKLREALEREGLTPARRLTDRGQLQATPRVSPDGRSVLYFSAPRDDWPTLRLADLEGPGDRIAAEVNSEGGAAFLPDGRRIVLSQTEVFAGYYYYGDLFLLDLATGKPERLTAGLRVSSPDVASDGRRVAFAQTELGQTRLGLLDLATGAVRPLTPWDSERHVYTPRFSPDGTRIVYSRSRPDGGREIWLLDLGSGRSRPLIEGRTMNLDPAFFPDGRRVVFTSDRTGIFNLHSVDVESGAVARLTNLLTGAFSPDPAPDGRGLAFVLYGARGYDIAWLKDLEARYEVRETRPARPEPPYPARADAQSPMPSDESPCPATIQGCGGTDQSEIYPSAPYRPLESLLPRAWAPTWGTDPFGGTYGLLISGQDAVGQIAYFLNLAFGPTESQLYADASVSLRLAYPTIGLYAGRHVVTRWDQASYHARAYPIVQEERNFSLDLSFPFASLRRYDALFFTYDYRLVDPWTEAPRDPADVPPRVPDTTPRAFLSVGWYGSAVQSYLDSISPEKGLAASASLRVSHPSLGSGARIGEARLWLRGYIPAVRRFHHVLAIGLQGGIAIGDQRSLGTYSVGGLPVRDVILDAYYNYRYSGLYLRGYPQGAFVGPCYFLGSLEYRAPLWNIERGFYTLPFYLERLHAAVFADVGGAGRPRLAGLRDLLNVGVGAELRLELLLGYYLPFTVRLGYGRGLMASGIDNWYLTLGSGF